MTPSPDQRESADRATDRFWDEIALGRMANPTGVEAADSATIRYLHANDDRPDPAPAFAKRLRGELMHASTLPVSSEPSPRFLPNGRTTQRPRRLPPDTTHSAREHRWRFVSLATLIALLVIGGGAGYRALGPGNDGGPTSIPVVPTPTVTPIPTVTPTPIADVDSALVSIDLPSGSLPQESYGATFDHRTMPPQSEATAQETGVFDLHYVISGNVTVSTTGPIQVRRALGDGSWEEIPTETGVTLGPGDAFFLRDAKTISFVNSGNEPVEFIAWMMTQGGGNNSDAPKGWSMHDNAAIHMAILDHPGVAARVRLRRVELAPQSDLPAPAGALVYQTVFLEINAEGEKVAPILGRLPDGGLRNSGRQSISLFELIVEPVDGEPAT